MVKRFNNLKAALKLLRPLAGGDAADLPDTTALGFFQAVQSGKRHVTYGDRVSASKPGTILEVAVIPFATPATDALYAKVPLSERASGKLTQASVLQTDLAYIDSGAAFSSALSLKGFRPAKATINVYGTGNTPHTSKLTGRSYKKANVTSYTFPFGLKADARTAGYNARKMQSLRRYQPKIRIAFLLLLRDSSAGKYYWDRNIPKAQYGRRRNIAISSR